MSRKEIDTDLLKKVREHGRKGTYFLAQHAINRNIERAINLPDILFVLEFGKREKVKDTFDINSTLYIFRRDFHNLLTCNRLDVPAMAYSSRLQEHLTDCRSKYCKTRFRKMYKVEIKRQVWKYAVRGKTTRGVDLRVIVALEETMVIITVIKVREKL